MVPDHRLIKVLFQIFHSNSNRLFLRAVRWIFIKLDLRLSFLGVGGQTKCGTRPFGGVIGYGSSEGSCLRFFSGVGQFVVGRSSDIFFSGVVGYWRDWLELFGSVVEPGVGFEFFFGVVCVSPVWVSWALGDVTSKSRNLEWEENCGRSVQKKKWKYPTVTWYTFHVVKLTKASLGLFIHFSFSPASYELVFLPGFLWMTLCYASIISSYAFSLYNMCIVPFAKKWPLPLTLWNRLWQEHHWDRIIFHVHFIMLNLCAHLICVGGLTITLY